MGIRGSSTCPLILQRLQGAGGESAGRDRQGTPHRLQHSERGPLQAGRRMCLGGARNCTGECHRLCQAAQGIRQDHCRFRTDSREAGQHGGRHFLRRRSHGLSHRRHDGCGACAAWTRPTTTRRRFARSSRNTRSSARSSRCGARRCIDYVVDEAVQIYGGYGFVEEYPAERNLPGCRASTGSSKARTRSTG